VLAYSSLQRLKSPSELSTGEMIRRMKNWIVCDDREGS